MFQYLKRPILPLVIALRRLLGTSGLEERLAHIQDARIDEIRRRSASMQATLSSTLVQPLQQCLDDSIRNVGAPLIAAAVHVELTNISLQIDRLASLNAPTILPALGDHRNYQSMVRAFLRRLRPQAAVDTSKVSVAVPALPNFILLQHDVRQVLYVRILPKNIIEATAPANSGIKVSEVPFEQANILLRRSLGAHGGAGQNILFVDVEGDEHECISALDSDVLGQFDQIILVLNNLSHLHAANILAAASKSLDKIEQHFFCVHIHARNTAGLCNIQNVALPNALEVSYVSKLRHRPTVCSEIYPTLIDQPTDPNMPDVYLGPFQY